MTTSTPTRPPTPDTTVPGVPTPPGPADLSARARALLRAVGAGTCRLDGADLVVDGRFCSDQVCARRLVGAGLVAPAGESRRGELTPAVLTVTGWAAIR